MKKWLAPLCVLVMVGCGGAETAERSGAEPMAVVAGGTATLQPGDAIPALEGDAVVRLEGDIEWATGGTGVELDLAALDAMQRVEVTVHEPFLKRDVEFSGVLLSDLFDVIGVSEDASTIRMHALDDYEVALPLDELDADNTLIATQSKGSPIALEDGGPIRLIFLSDDGLGANSDNWIWSIDEIRFS